jgi:hypothetical protein
MFYINRQENKKPSIKSKIGKFLEKLSKQNTWFYSDRKVFFKVKDLYIKLSDNEDDKSLSDSELNEIFKKIDYYESLISTDFHNCFITTKRNENGTHIDDIILSRQECIEWIQKNKSTITKIDSNKIEEFWDRYPNGVIDFG